MLHLPDVLGRCQYLPSVQRGAVFLGQGQETHGWVGIEQLDQAGRRGADQQPGGWQQGDPDVALALHLDQHHGAQHQCDTGQHLVGNAEQRPQGVDTPERVDHALIEQVAPHGHATGSSQQVRAPRLGALERRHETAQQILQHEAPGTSTGVHGGEDEQGLEQNGEVVPERHGVLAWQHLVKNLRDTHGQCRRTAGAGQNGVLANVTGNRLKLLRRNQEAPAADRLRHRNRVCTYHGSRAVHGEIHARLDHRSRDHGHDRHERFHQHATVADVAGVGFVIQQLGRGARRDQGMEPRYRATSDGDEQEREQRALPDRAGAIGELGQRWHLELRGDDQDADGKAHDGADLEEGRQVVTRGQHQPDRQHGGDKAVAHQHPGDLYTGKGESWAPDRIRSNLAAQPDGSKQQHYADDGNLTDAAGADIAHVDAHEHGDRDGRHHREHAPGALGQGLDHDQRQHREDDDHDQETAEQGDGARYAAHLFTHHVAQ